MKKHTSTKHDTHDKAHHQSEPAPSRSDAIEDHAHAEIDHAALAAAAAKADPEKVISEHARKVAKLIKRCSI